MSVLSRAAAVAVAGLIVAPVSALATGGHTGHQPAHHSTFAATKHALERKLAADTAHLARLKRELAKTTLSRQEHAALESTVASDAKDVARLRHTVKTAHTLKQLKHAAAGVDRTGTLVPGQTALLDALAAVNAELARTSVDEATLRHDEKCHGQNEERPALMRDLDNALTDLSDATSGLTRAATHLTAATDGSAPDINDAVKSATAGLGQARADVNRAETALRDFKARTR